MNQLIRTLAMLLVLAPLGACGTSDEPEDGAGAGNGDGTSDDHDGSAISDPAEFCVAMAQATCSKLIDCFTAEDREAQGLPATEQDCLDLVGDLCTPDTVCEPGYSYQPDLAGQCIDEVEQLTCDDARDDGLEEPGPSCADMCQ